MKYLPLLLLSILLVACTSTEKKEATQVSDSKPTEPNQVASNDSSKGQYPTLFKNYTCDLTIEEIASLLELPVTSVEIPTDVNQELSCIIRYWPDGPGTTPYKLILRSDPTNKAGNIKAIKKALDYKAEGVSILGSDIVKAETGDCYLEYIPVSGRINIRSEYSDGLLQLFYGPRGKRTKEEHEEMRIKLTNMANYLLKKHQQ